MRLCVDSTAVSADGSAGCYLGLDAQGALMANAPATCAPWEVLPRGHSADGAPLVALRSPAGRCVRITAKGATDCGGGNGRWTLFAVAPVGSALTFKSVGNVGKACVGAETVDWYLGVRNGKPAGDGPAFAFAVSPAEAPPASAALPRPPLTPQERAQLKHERMRLKEDRAKQRDLAAGPKPMTPEERAQLKHERMRLKEDRAKQREAQQGVARLTPEERMKLQDERAKAKAERMALKEQQMQERAKLKQERVKSAEARHAQKHKPADGNWCLVVKASKPATDQPVAAAVERAPQPTAAAAASTFPTGRVVCLKPVAFAEAANRKSTVGWHVGCAPMGYLVADASSGSWGQWRALDVAGHVVLETVHTPAFHLAIGEDLQLTHRGGKGVWAQWTPVPGPHGSFALKCAGHTTTDAYLAVSGSGVLYVASAQCKDTRFLVTSVVEAADTK